MKTKQNYTQTKPNKVYNTSSKLDKKTSKVRNAVMAIGLTGMLMASNGCSTILSALDGAANDIRNAANYLETHILTEDEADNLYGKGH